MLFLWLFLHSTVQFLQRCAYIWSGSWSLNFSQKAPNKEYQGEDRLFSRSVCIWLIWFLCAVVHCPMLSPLLVLSECEAEIRLCVCWWQVRSKTSRRVHKCFSCAWKRTQLREWDEMRRLLEEVRNISGTYHEVQEPGLPPLVSLNYFPLQECCSWDHCYQSCSVASEKKGRGKK